MKKFTLKTALAFLVLCWAGIASAYTDTYALKLSAKVPRIYDNTKSLGYRKYQYQVIKGYLHITYPENKNDTFGRPQITITDLYNKTHKVSGGYITYKCSVNNEGDSSGPITRVNLIGNNKTGEFKTASIVFYLDAEPSYNKGEDDEDNSLLITLAGSGKCKKIEHYEYVCCNGKLKKVKLGKCVAISSVSGNWAGTLGCGCYAYGHTSPTRVASPCGPSDTVDDVAATWGAWTISYVSSSDD